MNITKIENVIEKYSSYVTGKLGVYFYDLQTGNAASLHGDDVFPAASVIKIFILAEFLREVKAGKFSLSDKYLFKSKDKAKGSGVLSLLEGALDLTLMDYLTLMMSVSDNSASDVIFNLIGRQAIIDNIIAPLELHRSKCDLTTNTLIDVCCDAGQVAKNSPRNAPAYTCTLDLNDVSSPRDTAKMLELIYTHAWLGDDLDELAVSLLKSCQHTTRIPRYLPESVVVAHKTGTMDRVANDAGIIYTPKGHYILSVFYNGNVASEEEYLKNDCGFIGDDLIAKLSRDIYNVYVEKDV